MPELPEVETLCRQLRARITGRKILKTNIYDEKLDGLTNIRGRIIEVVRRSGKTIMLMLDDGQSIVIHLRMTGRLLWKQDIKRETHTRWRMEIEGGNIDLVDPRRFATIKIGVVRQKKEFKDLMKGFDQKLFLERQAKRRINVKVLLMDQNAIAGIGNIYACEILHRAGISPQRQASTLTNKEWGKIIRLAKGILKKGIAKRGTSISDWRDLYGQKGENQNELNVYGKKGKPCRVCGGIIAKIKQGGRSTFYCPQCQK